MIRKPLKSDKTNPNVILTDMWLMCRTDDFALSKYGLAERQKIAITKDNGNLANNRILIKQFNDWSKALDDWDN